MENKSFQKRLTSRKFIGSFALAALATTLLVKGYISPANWVTVVTIVYGAYVSVNGVEKFIQSVM